MQQAYNPITLSEFFQSIILLQRMPEKIFTVETVRESHGTVLVLGRPPAKNRSTQTRGST